jgi:diaminopimelate epimerase
MRTKKAIFHKYEACGNDYLIIPGEEDWFKPDSDLIKRICSTQYGVGSDGLLVVNSSKDHANELRIFNPDGSEAEKSGNGLRIYARYLSDFENWNGEPKKVNTLGGEVELKEIGGKNFSVNMGKASLNPEDIPLNDISPWVDKELKINEQSFKVTCVSLGNPHCVIEYNDLPSDQEIKTIGPMIENYPLFSRRINVQFAKILSGTEVEVKIWERGAGLTESSGSSSCAVVFVLNYLGKLDKTVQVIMKGGTLEVDLSDDGIWQTGPVNKIFSGELSEEFLGRA